MNVSIVIATFGDERWRDLAMSRAYPSALDQGAHEILVEHYPLAADQATARNNLASAATGDWLCTLDADDELDPGFLPAMQQTIRHYNLARPADLRENPLILVPAVAYIRADGTNGKATIPNGGLTRWPDINVAVVASLIPRWLFRDLGGFDAADVPYEDYGLWLRAERAGARLIEVPNAVYRAHVRDDSAHRNPGGAKKRVALHARLLREHREQTRLSA